MHHKSTLSSWRIIRRYTHLSVTALNYFIRHFNLLSIRINLKIAEHGDIILKFLQYFRLRMVSNINHGSLYVLLIKEAWQAHHWDPESADKECNQVTLNWNNVNESYRGKKMPPSLRLIHRKLKLLFVINTLSVTCLNSAVLQVIFFCNVQNERVFIWVHASVLFFFTTVDI